MDALHRKALAPLLAGLLLAACGDDAASPPHAAELPPGSLAGVVEPDLDAAPGEHAALLVMARRDPASALPDLLLRLPPAPLPQPFVLDARHLRRPGKVFGSWYLSARLDADGSVLPSAGDIEGTLGPVDTDTAGHVLTLDTRVTRTVTPEEAGLPADHPALTLPRADPSSATGGMPSGHPPVGAPPAGHATAAPTLPREPGPRFRGQLELGQDFVAKNGTGTLFLMLKSSTAARGMPRAVLRVDNPRFPLEFDIGPEHVPLQVENKADLLAGTLYLTARLDADGDALSKSPEDLESETLELQADQDPVTLALDRSRQ